MKVCIFLANNFEESEAINTIDILRRAKIDIDIISIYENLEVIGSHNIKIHAEKTISEIKNYRVYDCFILPGGPGVNELIKSVKLKEIFTEAKKNNKIIAAICAAPKILVQWNIINNHRITHFPNVLNYANSDHNVAAIIDQNIITGSSIGGSMKFALLIVEKLLGLKQREIVENNMVIR